MSARYRSELEIPDYEKPSACSNFMHYSWKAITCLFSHITLVSMVVSYCVLGAFAFEALELQNELEVKKGIEKLRENVTQHLWNFTQNTLLTLEKENFTTGALKYLKNFEGDILKAMTRDGWNGEEDEKQVQWTSTGALFYSIVVITTIGYGHIAPKTNWGKIVTIFYAILGIPLMLLTLSNIGDVMATSFRFIYWRVCCYVCTKKPKKRRERGRSFRTPSRNDPRLARVRNASFRRSVRTSGKSTDSGYPTSDVGITYHSDTELRYSDGRDLRRGVSLPNRPQRYSDTTPPSRKFAPQDYRQNNSKIRGGSLDRRPYPDRAIEQIELDPVKLQNTKVLCNKYVIGKNDVIANSIPVKTVRSGLTLREPETRTRAEQKRAQSMPRATTRNYLEPPRLMVDSSSDIEEEETGSRGRNRRRRRSRSPNPLGPSPKMMTPLGYGKKTKYLDDPDSDDEYIYEDGYTESGRSKIKPVPIWLCVLLVISYILAGAYLFKSWEGWDYLDSAYFCFITLTTIGFGDLVPAKGVSQSGYYATISIALCSLYLLFGISLLAMSFNLVQEEVISNVKSVAKMLGIIKSTSDDSDDDDD